MAFNTEEELTMSLLDTIDTNDECLLELCDAFQQISEEQLDDLLKDVDVDGLEVFQDIPEFTLEEDAMPFALEEPRKNQEPAGKIRDDVPQVPQTTPTDAVEDIILTLGWNTEPSQEDVEKKLPEEQGGDTVKPSQEDLQPDQKLESKEVSSKVESIAKKTSQKRKLSEVDLLEEFLVVPESPCPSPGASKRKRIRNAFTPEQLDILQEEFSLSEYCNTPRAIHISKQTSLPADTIKFWFQNQRYKKKNPYAPKPRKPRRTAPPADLSKTYVLYNGGYVRVDTLMQLESN